MNGRRREQFNGLYPGPYKVAGRYRADIAITAEGPEGPVVVGRIPTTKVIDAEAQSKAYAAMPDMIAALQRAWRDPFIAATTFDMVDAVLKEIGAQA